MEVDKGRSLEHWQALLPLTTSLWIAEFKLAWGLVAWGGDGVIAWTLPSVCRWRVRYISIVIMRRLQINRLMAA